MSEKPAKKLYKNQKDVLNKFKEFIIPLLKDISQIKEVWVWASMAEGKFGVYEKLYRDYHSGSDVDLVILLKKGLRVPKNWKHMQVPSSWFRGFYCKDFRNFKYKENIHKVDILLVKRKGIKRARERLKNRSIKIYLNGKSELE